MHRPLLLLLLSCCTWTPPPQTSWENLPYRSSPYQGPSRKPRFTQGPELSPAESLIMRWPVEPTAISSLFGKRLDPITRTPSFHRGVDLESPYGAIVTAAAAGRVTSAGWNRGHGRQVILTHAEGYRTVYSHLSQITVFPQDCIVQGQAIGRVGSSGRSTGPHLHFELTRRGKPLDPLAHLDVPLPPMARSGSSESRRPNDFGGG